ncbi:MAG: hypothetical protein ABIF12_00610 [bacterium]
MKKNILLLVFSSLLLSPLNSFTEQNAKKIAIANAVLGTALGFGMGISLDYVLSKQDESYKVSQKGLIGSSLLAAILGFLAYKDIDFSKPSSILKRANRFFEVNKDSFCMILDYDENFGEVFISKLEKHYDNKEYPLALLHSDLDLLLTILNEIVNNLEKSKNDFIKSELEKEYLLIMSDFENLKSILDYRIEMVVQSDLFSIQNGMFRKDKSIAIIYSQLFIFFVFSIWKDLKLINFSSKVNKNFKTLLNNQVALLNRIRILEAEDHIIEN